MAKTVILGTARTPVGKLGGGLSSLKAVELGGIAIEGGRGSIVGTLLAAVLLGSFTFALGMLNVSGIVMSMIVGGLLIAAMVLPRLWPARRAAKAA